MSEPVGPVTLATRHFPRNAVLAVDALVVFGGPAQEQPDGPCLLTFARAVSPH